MLWSLQGEESKGESHPFFVRKLIKHRRRAENMSLPCLVEKYKGDILSIIYLKELVINFCGKVIQILINY